MHPAATMSTTGEQQAALLLFKPGARTGARLRPMSMQTQAQVLERSPRGKEDRAKFWREPRYGDLECLAARFRTHVYELHTHETYVIGTITAGCERFEAGGVQYAASTGDLCC
jgi:hypothetical protein